MKIERLQKDCKEEYKMISEKSLCDIIANWIQPKIDEYGSSGGWYTVGSGANGSYWILYYKLGLHARTICERLCYDDKNDCIGYDIWTWYGDNVNIKIRKDSVEFIEGSEFEHFSKEEIRDLYDKIKNYIMH